MANTVVVVGAGEVGQWVLEFLGRRLEVDRIVLADVREDVGVYRRNAAGLSALLEGYSDRFDFRRLDLRDVDETARLIAELKPEVVFAAVTLNPWWVLKPDPMPETTRQKLLKAGFGVLLPWHVTLVDCLCRAMAKADTGARLLNASFPDVVNHVAGKCSGFVPTCGIGNHDLVAVEIRKRAGDRFGVPPDEVVLYFVGSHALIDQGDGVPHFVRILVGDRDVTKDCDVAEWIARPLAGFGSDIGRELNLYSTTGASAVKNIVAILRDTNQMTLAPGPNGRIGGYTVRLGRYGAKVELPVGLTFEEAVALNEKALVWEGIECVEEDGTVVYTEETHSIMKGLGYDCRRLRPGDHEERAVELGKLSKRWIEG